MPADGAAPTVLAAGVAPPQTSPSTYAVTVSASGTYYVTLNYPTGTTPTRASSAAYDVTFGAMTNPDVLNNHSLATAICPGGGSGPCSMAYSGSAVTLPSETSYLSVPGQNDYYRVDVTSGAPLVLEADITSSPTTMVDYAVDLLTAEPNSPCTADTDCVALNESCQKNTDCELSHACLQSGNYTFCPNGGVSGPACQLCAGAGVCIPQSNGGGLCAIPQYVSSFSPSGQSVGGPTVTTAQPLFSSGAYFIRVHDAHDVNVDTMNPYTLTLKMVPEPDPYDQSPVAAHRNNFYDPYPSSTSDETPNKARAVDITSDLMSGTPVTGYISYQADDDWFTFQHPCPGENCALTFTWIQPGPSPVQVAFYMLDSDAQTVNLSFAYEGTPTTLTMPITSTFNNQDCTKCSVALASATNGDGGPPYMYYLRIADVTQTHFDYSSGGKYSVSVVKSAEGCPAACSEGPNGCGCYCKEAGMCPNPMF
jgi:hypothetical protein